jgi:hypothetical protein
MASGKLLPRIRKVVIIIGTPLEPPAREGTRRRSEVTGLTEELRVELQRCFDDALVAAGARRVAAPER